MTISVIIPALNAEKELPELLKALSGQTVQPDEILLTDSESADGTRQIAEAEGVRVIPVPRKDFDHGGTRDMALRASSGEGSIPCSTGAHPQECRGRGSCCQEAVPFMSGEETVADALPANHMG